MAEKYNYELVAELIAKVKGCRTLRAFATDVGIDVATLSKICTGKRKATVKNLQLLVSESTNSQSKVTLNELLIAAGYVDVKDSNVKSIFSEDIIKKAEDLEMKVIGALHYKFLQNGFYVEPKKEVSKGYSPDIKALIDGKNWCFEIVAVSDKLARYNDIAKSIFAKLVMAKPDKACNTAVIVDSLKMYETLASYAGEIAFKGNLTAICFDAQKMAFTNEIVLSSYDDTEVTLLS